MAHHIEPLFSDPLALEVLAQAVAPFGAARTNQFIEREPFTLSMVFTPGPPEPPPPLDPMIGEIARTHPLNPLGALDMTQMAQVVLAPAMSQRGKVEFNKRIEPDPDDKVYLGMWFQPGPPPAKVPDHLRLLARICRLPSMFEIPLGHVNVDELHECTFRQLNWEKNLFDRGEISRDENSDLPPMWILARNAMPEVRERECYGFRPKAGWPQGIYFNAPAMRQRLVVLPELPLTRRTVVFHLLGNEPQRAQARTWIGNLSPRDPNRGPLLLLLSRFAS